MSRKNIITLLLSLGLLTLAGCNGNNAEQANNSNNAPIAVVEDTTIVLNERSYDLLTLPNSTTLPFKVYWPADVSLSDTDTKDVLDNFVVVNDVINSHFSISMAALAHKSIIFTPQVSETPSATQFSTIGPEQLQVTFSDHTRAFEGDFSQQILSFLYVSERIKKTADSSAFDRLITLGLTLHFLENSLTNATLPANTSLSATELLSALTQVKQAMADGKAHTDWFEDAGIAAPVGYYLAAQHFNYYPGSRASNTLTLASEFFTPWLDNPAPVQHKIEQYVRTDNVPNQVVVSELTRQSNKFVGGYFLEGHNQEKLIALTFDDGPSQYTAKILDVLAQTNAKASFFWQGSNLASYQEEVERSIAEGHTVANHSWSHPHSAGFSADKLWQEQVLKTNEQFQHLVNITPRFYRPPYGEVSDEQVAFLGQKGMKVILWSVDPRDWNTSTNTIENIRSEVINHQHPEMITLMHDSGGNRQNTVDALAEIIEHYKAQGYKFVNLETLLGISDKG